MLERRGYNETDKRRDKSGTAPCQKRHQLAAAPGGEKQRILFNADLGPSDVNLIVTFNHLDTAKRLWVIERFLMTEGGEVIHLSHTLIWKAPST